MVTFVANSPNAGPRFSRRPGMREGREEWKFTCPCVILAVLAIAAAV